jgi:cell division GTPase FtsZ
VGKGDGEDACREALDAFLSCPLTGGRKALEATDAAVLTLLGGNDLSIREIQSCLSDFQTFFPRKARLEVGAYTDESPGKHVQLTALMCRYEAETHQPALPLDLQADTKENKPPARSKKPAQLDRDGQFRLPLTEQTLGIFRPGEPTLVNGQNLDIPTFQRRGVEIDIGV